MTSSITEAHALLALIGIFLDTFIYCPLIIYWSINIWRERYSLIIRKRHCRIIITIGIVSCLYYLIQRNIGFLIYSDILSFRIILILTYINCYLYPIFNYGLFYIMVYRYWLLYYKTKFASAQTNGEWQMIINPSEYHKNWWINNKKKYGSGHFIKKYIILLWIIIICIEGTLWLYSYYLNSYILTYISLSVDFLIILFPLILTIYIRQNLPTLIDKLRIKQELKYIFLIIFLAFVVITILSSIIGAFSYFFIDFNQNISRSLYNTIANISTFATFLCVFIQTQWVINKFSKHLHYYSSRQILKTTLTQQILLTKKEKNENKDKISISDVLTHQEAFYVFMNHLIEEHSSECLLALVEMIQFKECILNDMKAIQPPNININNAPITINPINRKERHLSIPSKDRKDEEDEDEDEEKEKDKETEIIVNDNDNNNNINTEKGRSSAVQRNINALTLALSRSASYDGDTNNNSMVFASSNGSPTPRTISLRSRGRSGSFQTSSNGLIIFPRSVPKSAIIYNKELNFLIDIPGVEISPKRKRGTRIDEDVINKSALIRHVSTPSNNNTHAIWKQKRSSTVILKKQQKGNESISNVSNIGGIDSEIGLMETKKSSIKSPKNRNNKKSVVLHRSEGELIEEWKIRGYMLYYKYIAIGSEYEINIDYGTRNKLIIQMNDINECLKDEEINLNDLSLLFDNCIHQMYQFCKFSMGRFRKSQGFEALVTCFNIQPHHEEAPTLIITPVSP